MSGGYHSVNLKNCLLLVAYWVIHWFATWIRRLQVRSWYKLVVLPLPHHIGHTRRFKLLSTPFIFSMLDRPSTTALTVQSTLQPLFTKSVMNCDIFGFGSSVCKEPWASVGCSGCYKNLPQPWGIGTQDLLRALLTLWCTWSDIFVGLTPLFQGRMWRT